jgi:predicted esterase
MPVLAQDLPSGKILDRVVCRDNDQQSYALYVPSSYTPGRAWPIVYCLDPGARGRVPVERFAAAAEKYGYLVAGSNNSRNGPYTVIVDAIQAMVKDTHMRLSIDDNRIYAAGHSGGANASLRWALNGSLAGVVASAATEKPGNLPVKGFRLFASTGIDDFAYYNVHALSQELARRGIENRYREFDGGHEWLPASSADEALQFFDGRLPAEPAVASKEVKSLSARFEQMSMQLFQAGEAERTALVHAYARDAAKSSNAADRRLARQILNSAYIAFAENARQMMAKHDYTAAAKAWEVDVVVRPENGQTWYSLAVAQAGAGNKRRALEALEKAAANGFRDAARIEHEPLLAPVRGDRRYQAILESINQSGNPAGGSH